MKLGGFMIMFVCMIMFLEFLSIPTGASVILGSFGIEINPNTVSLIKADVESSSFFEKIFNNSTGILLLIAGTGAIIVGLFAKGYDPSIVILPLIVLIGTTLAQTIWILIKYMQSFGVGWATNIVTLILFGVGIGFIMSCVDYFAGR